MFSSECQRFLALGPPVLPSHTVTVPFHLKRFFVSHVGKKDEREGGWVLTFLDDFSLCVYTCVYIHLCVYTCVHAPLFMKARGQHWCLLLLVSTLFFEMRSSAESGVHWLCKATSPAGLWDCSQAWEYKCGSRCLAFYLGARIWNSQALSWFTY